MEHGFELTPSMIIAIAGGAVTAIGVVFRLFLSSQERLISQFNDRASEAEKRTAEARKDFSDERREYKTQIDNAQKNFLESLRSYEMQSKSHTAAIEELTEEIRSNRHK